MKELDQSIYCAVRCHSHVLTPIAFDALMSDNSLTRIREVTESTFFFWMRRRALVEYFGHAISEEDFPKFASYTLATWIMALNVGTLGHFEWVAKTAPVAAYSLVNHETMTGVGLTSKSRYKYPSEKEPLTKAAVQRSMLVFGSLAQEKKPYFRTEYLKGVYHFGLEFFDLSFRKDAFANFYRCFEHFITDRVLSVRKLRNECKQLSGGLRKLGVPDAIVDIFRNELYPLRSAQVMHSQTQQVEIEWEQVAKIKALTDTAMHLHFQPLWKTELGAMRSEAIGAEFGLTE